METAAAHLAPRPTPPCPLSSMETHRTPHAGPAVRAAQYHSWLMRSTFNVVVRSTPTYTELLKIVAHASAATDRLMLVQAAMSEFAEAGWALVVALETAILDLQLEDIRPV